MKNPIIKFRSNHHKIWFTASMFMLLTAITVYAIYNITYLFENFYQFHISVVIATPIGLMLYKVIKRKSEIISVDCIWFNALMAAMHFGFYLYLT